MGAHIDKSAETAQDGASETAWSPQSTSAPSPAAVHVQKSNTAQGYDNFVAIDRTTGGHVGQISKSTTAKGADMEIANLHVAPSHRKQGVSNKLMTTALQAGRAQGQTSAYLHARPEDSATKLSTLMSMYRKRGFSSVPDADSPHPKLVKKL